MKTSVGQVCALASLLLAAAAVPARAQSAASASATSDTTLDRFLGAFSDSTDAYFGASAAPADTAGLDSVLADTATRRPRRIEVGFAPSFHFNRVDGTAPGVRLALSGPQPAEDHTGWGRLEGDIARANGPRTTLGGAGYKNGVWLAGQRFDLSLWAGRASTRMNRDEGETYLGTTRALIWGTDWTHYYRVDGFEGSLAHEHGAWRASAGWRDELQSPLATTATWNLLDRPLAVPGNLAATCGRARELDLQAGLRWPRVPLRTEIGVQSSSRRLGSDFEYTRVRAAAGLDVSLGRSASLVPQAAWGRLTGDALPQASFYEGAGATLRSLHRDERGGTGLAIAKVDLIGAQDLLQVLRIPHPDALPLQGALFAASGAVWGRDPYSGIVVRGADGPDRRDWMSEAGVALLYRTVLFEPKTSLRFSYAWPIGPGERSGRWSLSFSRALDLLGPEPEEE